MLMGAERKVDIRTFPLENVFEPAELASSLSVRRPDEVLIRLYFGYSMALGVPAPSDPDAQVVIKKRFDVLGWPTSPRMSGALKYGGIIHLSSVYRRSIGSKQDVDVLKEKECALACLSIALK